MDTHRQVERANGDAVCYTGIMRAEEEEEEDDESREGEGWRELIQFSRSLRCK